MVKTESTQQNALLGDRGLMESSTGRSWVVFVDNDLIMACQWF